MKRVFIVRNVFSGMCFVYDREDLRELRHTCFGVERARGWCAVHFPECEIVVRETARGRR
jgi:hypothetical protein